MKHSLYDTLQVSKLADQEVIEVAYQRLFEKLQSEGSPDSLNRAKIIKIAYDTLSNPEKRALYDEKLKYLESTSQIRKSIEPSKSQYRSDFEDSSEGWWKSPIVTLVIVISALLIGFSLFTGHTDVINKVEIVKETEYTKRQGNELDAGNVSKHLDNEGTLINGVIDIASQEAERRRVELEYRANAGSQQLEMERREQEARLNRQRELDAETRRQRDMAYYACINSAVDRRGNADATLQARCYR